jgi:hypothetical protein
MLTLTAVSDFLVIVPDLRPVSPRIMEASSYVYEIHYMPISSGSQSSATVPLWWSYLIDL